MPYRRSYRKRSRKYSRRPPKVRSARGQKRALKLVPFKNPRSFTGSVMSPQTENVLPLTHIGPAANNMTTGQASKANILYEMHCNDLFAPWILLPGGDGNQINLANSGDIQTLITGLNEAFDSSSPAGFNRAACVATSMQLTLQVPPRISYQLADATGNGAGTPVIENMKPFYIYCTMSTHLNGSGLNKTISTGLTFEEIRVLPGVRMWKVTPSDRETRKTFTITIPSVMKYLKGQWNYDSAGVSVTDFPTPVAGDIQQSMIRYDQARHLIAQTNSTPFLTVTDADRARIIHANWGVWAPNCNDEVTQKIRFSTRMKLIQKVRFYEARDPALTTETV